MAEYIEKQAAIKELCAVYEYEYPTAHGAFDEYATKIVPNVLRNFPPADVRPVVRGRWIEDGLDWLECSSCGAIWWRPMFTKTRWSYCPNCGAKMEGNE